MTSMDLNCEDFSMFQEMLKQLRTLDDKVVYELNTSIPTKSFAEQVNASERCKELFHKLHDSHKNREDAIKHCVSVSQRKIEGLRKIRQGDMDDVNVLNTLRKEQTHLRFMQGELMVEEVVQQSSMKVFTERCRMFYNPKELS